MKNSVVLLVSSCDYIYLLGNKGENLSEEDLKNINQNITNINPNFSYFKVSARDNINISEVFENIAEKLIKEDKENKSYKCHCSIN